MKKLLFDAKFNSRIENSMTFSLFDAIKSVVSDYEISTNLKASVLKKIALPRALEFLFSKADLIFFPNADIPALISKYAFPVTQLLDVKPLSFFDADSDELKKYRRKIRTLSYRAGLIFVPTEYMKKQITEDFSEELSYGSELKVLGIASVIDEKYLDLPLNVNNEKYFFTHVDDLVYGDGLNELLKTFIYMHTTGRNNTKLYISGVLNTSDKELAINIEVARKIGVIREYKNLSDGQRALLMRGAIAGLFPSKEQNLPISHLDAMKCSCPVVTFDTPAIREICDDSVIYADIDDTGNYKNILYALEHDEEYRKAYIYKGLYREKIFSWQNVARNFIENIELAFQNE